VVRGVQRVRPGAEVSPRPVSAAPAAQTAAPPAPAPQRSAAPPAPAVPATAAAAERRG
jgi:hypothetical protein